MKNKVIKISALIITSCFLLWSTQYLLTSVMKDSKEGTLGKINGVVAHKLDYELTIWGASTAYVNFNPQIIIDSLKISALNMGIDGTSIDQYAGLLKEYLSYTNKSKYLVIALDIHGGLTKRESFYNMHNWLHNIDNKNIYECLSDIDKSTMLKLKYVPFYSLTQYDKHSFPYFRRSLLNKDSKYQIPNHGFKSNGNASIEVTNQSTPFKVSIDERPFKKVKEVITNANKKGIKCFIIITPCYDEGLSQITNKTDFISKLKTLETSKIEVLDFSNSYLSKNPSYFKDNTHLNASGADELTRLLIKKIRATKKNTTFYDQKYTPKHTKKNS